MVDGIYIITRPISAIVNFGLCAPENRECEHWSIRARVNADNMNVFARMKTATVNFGLCAPENCDIELRYMRARELRQ